MKQHSQLYKFFIGTRIPIDEDKLNYKELLYLKWNRFIRWFTNILYFLLLNAFYSLGWYSISKGFDFSTGFKGFVSSAPAVLMGIGQFTSNGIHFIINKFSKEKTRKDIIKSGNPVPKRSNLGLVFMLISIIPPLLWIIGTLIIKIKCNSYITVNGSLFRPEQKINLDKEINAKVLDQTMQGIGKVLKEIK